MRLSEVNKTLVRLSNKGGGAPRWVPITQIPKKVRRGMLRNARAQRGEKFGTFGTDDVGLPFKPQPKKTLEMTWGQAAVRRSQMAYPQRQQAQVRDRQGMRRFAESRRGTTSFSIPMRTSGSQPPRGIVVHRPTADAKAFSSLGGTKVKPRDVLRHEVRHLTQPMPKKGKLSQGASDQLKTDRAWDRGAKAGLARQKQLVQRGEAWADTGSRITSGHVWTHDRSGALSYARARRKMSTGILGRPDPSPDLRSVPRPVESGKNKNRKFRPTGSRKLTPAVEAKLSRDLSTGRSRRSRAETVAYLRNRGISAGTSRRADILRGDPGWFKAGTPTTVRRGRDQAR